MAEPTQPDQSPRGGAEPAASTPAFRAIYDAQAGYVWNTLRRLGVHTSDLEDALIPALEAHGFRRGAGALFVWEGVIGYIDNTAIDRSLRFMARAGGAGSRLVFTFGDGSFAPDTAAERTRRAGFSSCEELGLDEVWQRYLPGDPHPYAGVSKLGTATV